MRTQAKGRVELDIMLGETALLYHRASDKISRFDQRMVVDRKRLGAALALAECLYRIGVAENSRVQPR